jgi:hypothetical protein
MAAPDAAIVQDMTHKASPGIVGWVVSVTTRACGEDVPRVSLFDVAKADPKEAIDAVRRACGAPAKMVAIKTHLTPAPLALMRIEPGEMRMRKSHKPPRDIAQLIQRIREMETCEHHGRDVLKRKGRS